MVTNKCHKLKIKPKGYIILNLQLTLTFVIYLKNIN